MRNVRIIVQALDEYQSARMKFVQIIADMAIKKENAEYLHKAGILDLLHPLVGDTVYGIQQVALLGLARLANHDMQISEDIISKDILPNIVAAVPNSSSNYKKLALFLLRAVSRHSPSCASFIVQCGGLDAMISSLEDVDSGVKEAAAWAIGYIGRHDVTLGQAVADVGAIPLLVLCLYEPDISLQRIAASALSDISHHSVDLAEKVVNAGALQCFAKLLCHLNTKLKRTILEALANVAKHSLSLTELVVETEVFPTVLLHMGHPDILVRHNASKVVCEIAKQSIESAQMIVNSGGIGALVELIGNTKGYDRLPSILALGYIAGQSEQLAMAIITSQGADMLQTAFEEESDNFLLIALVWAIGQVGKHTPEHSKAVCSTTLLTRFMDIYSSPDTSPELQLKTKTTLKLILQKCTLTPVLDSVLFIAPSSILKYIVAQYSKILPTDAKARRQFVASGALKKIQEIQAEPETPLLYYISTINSCFPEEIIRYYSPGYSETILDQVEQFEPKIEDVKIFEDDSHMDFTPVDIEQSRKSFAPNPDIIPNAGSTGRTTTFAK